jgi:myosin heavy subunit
MAALSGQAVGAAARKTQEAEVAYRKQQAAAEAQRAVESDYRNFQQQLALYRIQQSDSIAADLRQLDKQRAIDEYKDQLEIESEKRAHAWELEKREAHSRIDEESRQRQRAADMEELDAGLAEVEKITDPQQREAAKLALQLKKYRVSDVGSILRSSEGQGGMSPSAYNSLLSATSRAREDLMSRSYAGPVVEGEATAIPTSGRMPDEVKQDPALAEAQVQYFMKRQDVPANVRKDMQELITAGVPWAEILRLDELQPYIEAL